VKNYNNLEQRMAVSYLNQCEYRLCPLYPGFNFCFTRLDEELAENRMAF
jgi:hypothetical protein